MIKVHLLKKLYLMLSMVSLRSMKKSKKKEIMQTELKKRLRKLIRNNKMPQLNNRKSKILKI